MDADGTVRWGILGAANIARNSFLPAVRATGGAAAASVGARNRQDAEQFAKDNGVERAVQGYEAILDDPDIDAVYIPLPNGLHAEWSIRAMEAGKAVLCEKPLCSSAAQTADVLRVARERNALLWEAFVFPFRPSYARLLESLESEEIGDLLSITSTYQFALRDRNDIRMSPDLMGGALNDVGCYPIHFGTLLLGEPTSAAARAVVAPEGVDETAEGAIEYADTRSMLFSCSMVKRQDTFTRLIGSKGEIRLSNPFHPGPNDTMEIRTASGTRTEQVAGDEPSFRDALRHIQAVLREQEAPRHLATVDAQPTADAMQLVRDAAGIQ